MMLKPRPTEIINRDCPFCDMVHDVEHHIELSTLPIKGDEVECVVEYFRCPINKIDGEDSWTPAGMLDENLLRLRDSYRVKHNLLTSDEIVSIRKKYGLSQKELSDLFGWAALLSPDMKLPISKMRHTIVFYVWLWETLRLHWRS